MNDGALFKAFQISNNHPTLLIDILISHEKYYQDEIIISHKFFRKLVYVIIGHTWMNDSPRSVKQGNTRMRLLHHQNCSTFPPIIANSQSSMLARQSMQVYQLFGSNLPSFCASSFMQLLSPSHFFLTSTLGP